MDANAGQVELVKDINPEFSENGSPLGSFPGDLIEFKDKLYFVANDGETGLALYTSDGSTEGTQLVTDIYPGIYNSQARFYISPLSGLTEFNDQLYFSADNGESGRELFVSDGTAAGTQLVADIFPGESKYGYNYNSSPSDLIEFKDKLYFSADDGENGRELFVTDGTAEGTQLVADIFPGEDSYGNSNSSDPNYLVEFKDKLYFSANDGESGEELFVTDGTAEGTQLVADIFPGENIDGNSNGSSPFELIEFNDKLYFNAFTTETGNELYVSDGTAEGTQLLVDLDPGKNQYGYGDGSSPRELTEFNGKLYFTAFNSETGNELYVSDGTAEGTQLLVDLNPAKNAEVFLNSSFPSDLMVFDNKLYFAANDGVHGNELFVSDGTAEGTQLVADLNPGENSYGGNNDSDPVNLTVVGDELFFSANNGSTGAELFKLTADNSSEGTSGSMTITGSEGDDLFVLQTGEGSDTIFEFDLGSDRFGLADGLQFDELSFSGNTIFAGEQVLATLEGINTEQLTSCDFQTI
jgi:ELWxxDGT repeat protein